MNYLEQLGLGDLCEDEDFFMYMMQHICENGEVFCGYYGYYIWYRWFDILELNCHLEPYGDKNQLTGFTSHISSDCRWQLVVADRQQESPFDEKDGETYILEREYDFIKMRRKTPFLQGWGYKARLPTSRKCWRRTTANFRGMISLT